MGKTKKEKSITPQKFEDLSQALDLEKRRSEEYLTRLKYLQADLDNMKKRFEKQIKNLRTSCCERIILKLLDIVDELEIAVELAKDSNSNESLTEGVEMTLKKLRKVLSEEGVSSIDCEWKQFDPSKHDAVSVIKKEGIDGCIVAEEVRKGYIMQDKVIRPSVVKVIVNSDSQEEKKENE